MSPHFVLITGAAGAIGQPVAKALLARGHTVRAFDRRPTPNVADAHVGEITDPAAVDRAVAGVDTLIHLAATTDDADFLTQLLPANIVGLYHVMEAARRHNVKRLILASTGQTTSGFKAPPGELIPTSVAAPMNGYAVTKLFAEDLGHMYALRHGMSVICARITFFPRNRKEAQHFIDRPKSRNAYFSHDDAGRFFTCAVEAENIKYAVLWAASRRPDPGGFDLGPSRELIGYEPKDLFPEGLPFHVP